MSHTQAAEGKPVKPPFELVEILEPGESSLPGNKVLERASELGVASGKEEAGYLLQHQDEIPEAWRSCYLVFPKYSQDDDGRGDVAYFYWSDGERRWVLNFRWLDDDFIFVRGDRFVRRSE